MARKNKNRATGENTVIGTGTVVGGSIVSDAMVIRIDGKVNGSVDTKGDLIIGPEGEVNGDVTAFSLILAGKVIGNANVNHRIEIEAGGKLIGDIETELLAMDETAMYQGKVTMRGLAEEVAATEPEAAPVVNNEPAEEDNSSEESVEEEKTEDGEEAKDNE